MVLCQAQDGSGEETPVPPRHADRISCPIGPLSMPPACPVLRHLYCSAQSHQAEQKTPTQVNVEDTSEQASGCLT